MMPENKIEKRKSTATIATSCIGVIGVSFMKIQPSVDVSGTGTQTNMSAKAFNSVLDLASGASQTSNHQHNKVKAHSKVSGCTIKSSGCHGSA